MKKTNLSIILPIFITVAAYSLYIKMPFDDYDSWLQNIAFSGFSYDSLPQNLKNIDIPTSVKDYLSFSASKFGRIGGYTFSQYLLVNIFNRDVFLWRSFSILLIICTILVIRNILFLLKVNYKTSLIFLCVCPFFLSYNFILIITSIGSLAKLFLLIALNFELKNSSEHSSFKISYSVLGSVFIFLTLLYHELTFTYGIVIFFIIWLWHNNGSIKIRNIFNLKRFIPYVFPILIYSIIFVCVFIFVKEKNAYAGFTDIFDEQIIKNFVLKILLFFGFNISTYLGLVLLFVSLIFTMYVIVLIKKLPDDLQYFKIGFSLIIIITTSFITSILSQETNESWIIQILAVFIFYSTLYEFIIRNAKTQIVNFFSFFVILFTFIICFLQINKTYAQLKFWESNNTTFNRLTDFLYDNLPKKGVVLFQNIPVTKCYTIVGDVFLKGRHDGIQYYLQNCNNNYGNKYVDNLINSFNQNIVFENPDFTIMYANSDKGNSYINNNRDLITVINEPVNQTFFDKWFLNLKNSSIIKPGLKSIIFKFLFGLSQNSFFQIEFNKFYVYRN